MKKIARILISVAVLLLLAVTICLAATLNATWVANSESDMASYKLYSGSTLIATIQHPTTTYDITNVVDGTYTYYLSAVDTAGNESAKSDGVTIVVNTTPPSKPTLKVIIKN